MRSTISCNGPNCHNLYSFPIWGQGNTGRCLHNVQWQASIYVHYCTPVLHQRYKCDSHMGYTNWNAVCLHIKKSTCQAYYRARLECISLAPGHGRKICGTLIFTTCNGMLSGAIIFQYVVTDMESLLTLNGLGASILEPIRSIVACDVLGSVNATSI